MPWFKPSSTTSASSRNRKPETRYTSKDKDGFFFPIYSRNPGVDFAALFGPPPPYHMYTHGAAPPPVLRPVEPPRERAYAQVQAPVQLQMVQAPQATALPVQQSCHAHLQPRATAQKALPAPPASGPTPRTASPKLRKAAPHSIYGGPIPLPNGPTGMELPRVLRRRTSSLESVVSPITSPRRTLTRRHTLTAAPLLLYSSQDGGVSVFPPGAESIRAVRFNEDPIAQSPRVRHVDTWDRGKTPRRGCLKRHTF